MEKEYLYVVISSILFGSIIFGGQVFIEMGLSAYEISIFRLAMGLVLLPLIIFKKEYRITKPMIPIFIAFGIISAINLLTQYTALMLGVPIAIVVFLLYTQPLWTSIFGKIFLKEKFTRNKILAVVLSLIGIGIIIDPFGVKTIGSWIGIILSVIAGICLSCWIIYSRKAGIKKFNPVTSTFGWILFGLIFISLSYPIVNTIIQDTTIIRLSFDQPTNIWIYMFIYTLFTTIIPYPLFFKGIEKVKAISAGIILMLEPISASILAWFFLSQALTINIIIGGALILLANYLVIKKK